MKIITVDGDLIKLAKLGNFDAVAHGCNCFNRMKSGIAVEMMNEFGCDTFPMELTGAGDYNKLGQIDFHSTAMNENQYKARTQKSFKSHMYVINAYTQYNYGKDKYGNVRKNVIYPALQMCMMKIDYYFKDMVVGIPKIGAGLAGGDWDIIFKIIKENMTKVKALIIVEYDVEVEPTLIKI